MKNILHLLILLIIVLSTACGADDPPDYGERLTKACLSNSNMGTEICQCVAEKAKTDLSPAGIQFLVATLEKDSVAAEHQRKQMPLEELVAAGMFMTKAPSACAQR